MHVRGINAAVVAAIRATNIRFLQQTNARNSRNVSAGTIERTFYAFSNSSRKASKQASDEEQRIDRAANFSQATASKAVRQATSERSRE